jgi:hypothetical protein
MKGKLEKENQISWLAPAAAALIGQLAFYAQLLFNRKVHRKKEK